MNERILNLADQAGIAVWGDAVYMYDPKDTLDSTVMEKFAELIVRECAEVIFETPVKYTEIDIMHIIRDRVKEHFDILELNDDRI